MFLKWYLRLFGFGMLFAAYGNFRLGDWIPMLVCIGYSFLWGWLANRKEVNDDESILG